MNGRWEGSFNACARFYRRLAIRSVCSLSSFLSPPRRNASAYRQLQYLLLQAGGPGGREVQSGAWLDSGRVSFAEKNIPGRARTVSSVKKILVLHTME